MPFPFLILASSFFVAYVVHKLFSYKRGIAALGYFPDKFFFLPRTMVAGGLTRQIKFVTPGANLHFVDKYRPFSEVGWDVYALTSVFPTFGAIIEIADAAVAKEVMGSRHRFPKHVDLYTAINYFGPNILSAEGDEWKKYRKICAPAFSNRNNELVWNETVKTVQGMFDDVWKDQSVITVDHCVDITLPIALFVIGAAGFGRRISWLEDVVIPEGFTMSFKEALHVVASNTITALVVPASLMGVTAATRHVRQGFKELRMYMTDMIDERRHAEKSERHDLLSSLLEANNDELDISKMTDVELIGNIYIFLLAGHETTAHTLCFAFALLAFYPDEQEELLKQIKSIVPNGQNPTYEQISELTYASAVFNETLRLFPPISATPKIAAEDTTLTTHNVNGESFTIPIPKGTGVEINISALHYNPRYWKDPHSFTPSRFLEEDWPRDAFSPFSGGARGCLGRKFFETEGLAILTMIVSQYEITITDEPKFASETFEERKARVLDTHVIVSLTPHRVPLTFTKRK